MQSFATKKKLKLKHASMGIEGFFIEDVFKRKWSI